MKKSLLALTLVTLSTTSFAATQAELVLKGIVAPVLDISIVAETVAASLDLNTLQTNLKVATITEKTNYHTGYKVKAKSTNGGKLVNVNDSTSTVPYTLNYGGANLVLTSSPTQIHTTSTKGTYSKDIKISYNQPTNLSAGSHEDVVQFTIEAN